MEVTRNSQPATRNPQPATVLSEASLFSDQRHLNRKFGTFSLIALK
jgi:hypothetical protein